MNAKILIFFIVMQFFSAVTSAQTSALNAANYRVFDAKGNTSNISQILAALNTTDVLFLGEQHDDPTAHALQLEILKLTFERYGKKRPIVLSLEMFERDVQLVIDEYSMDLINENNFITSSRAWNNYKTDYRPLVEYAKQNKLSIIAANAPRRYVNRVSRLGRESLDQLSPTAKQLLAPLPFAAASDAYAKKFATLFGGSAHDGNSRMLDAQSLWDATMAFSIAESLKKYKNALVIHLNGSFHSEGRLGAPEHLLRYNPQARFVAVTMKSTENFPIFDNAKDTNAGDFVILTDPKLLRSFK